MCPLGYYCEDSKVKVPCPAGKYGEIHGAKSEVEGCKPCTAGYYCEVATQGPLTKSIICPPGHFCPEGTKTAFQNPCPNGQYNNEIGIERSNQCKSCPPGRYCVGGDPTGDTLCPTGHYCPGKTSSENQNPCTAGTYTELRGATCKEISYI